MLSRELAERGKKAATGGGRSPFQKLKNNGRGQTKRRSQSTGGETGRFQSSSEGGVRRGEKGGLGARDKAVCLEVGKKVPRLCNGRPKRRREGGGQKKGQNQDHCSFE